jgi:prolyl-tRNA editing enzyme YbaK/EbsC (Cys-tRNA(Pro) deacylase)
VSLQSVRAFLSEHAPDLQIVQQPTSTATVEEAARAHGVEPAQIAKTLSLRLHGEVILLVMGGDARIHNQKFKAHFNAKAKLLSAEDVAALTGHPVGGVCPFGLSSPLRVYADRTLRTFEVVILAAGDRNATMRIAADRIAQLAHAEWIDVAEDPAG